MDLAGAALIESFAPDVLLADVPLKPYLSIRAGGAAKWLYEAQSAQGICRVLKRAHQLALPLLILGNGSNTLVCDRGFDGLVLHLGAQFAAMRVEGERLLAQGGALTPVVSKLAAEHALEGLEFAAGIPGSIGGAICMNAGAYCGEMSAWVEALECADRRGNTLTLSNQEAEFGYRHSRVMREQLIILNATLRLQPGRGEDILARMEDYQARRKATQPLNWPSAGSFFKRPAGYFAGALIEQAGLKGFAVGGAAVSQMHAGFLINQGDATAQDFIDLAKHVQATVKAKFDVSLEPEVRIIGG